MEGQTRLGRIATRKKEREREESTRAESEIMEAEAGHQDPVLYPGSHHNVVV